VGAGKGAINLGYTEIHAPIDGQISSTAVTEGNVVSPDERGRLHLGSPAVRAGLS
jgi:multidrug resistance efflux pump